MLKIKTMVPSATRSLFIGAAWFALLHCASWFATVSAQLPGQPGFKFAGNYLDFWRDLEIETTPEMNRPTLFDVVIDSDPYMN